MANGYELGTAKTLSDAVSELAPAKHIVESDDYHPEWPGSNVFGLERVKMTGGGDSGSHLIGTISKYAKIYNFTTGEVVYDFSDLGAAPRSGGDSYCCSCEWNGKYYFAGWVIAPHDNLDSFDVEDKYTYLIELDPSQGFDNGWSVIYSDRAGDYGLTTLEDGWAAEVNDITPSPTGVYLFRKDDGGSGVNQGVWKYDGTTVTQLNSDVAEWGEVVNGKVWYRTETQSDVKKIDPQDDTITTESLGPWNIRAAAGRVSLPATRNDTGQKLVRWNNGALSYKPGNGIYYGEDVLVPLFMGNINNVETGDNTRSMAKRGGILRVGGGFVAPFNLTRSSGTTNTVWDAVPSYLCYVSPPNIQIIDSGTWFGDIQLYNDAIYYGATSSRHGNGSDFVATQNDDVSLSRIPLEKLSDTSRQPPVNEPINYNYTIGGDEGFVGLLGGVPTAGYDNVKITLEADVAGTATVYEWGWFQNRRELGTISVSSTPTMMDFSDEATGGVIGFDYDTDAVIKGSIQLS